VSIEGATFGRAELLATPPSTSTLWLAPTLGDFGHLWLSEVQARARCKQRGCKGAMRLAMPQRGGTKGFVGGIA